MTLERLTSIPDQITAGDTVEVTLSLADFPASAGWSLVWSLAGASVLAVESDADGDDHALDISAIESAALEAGLYQWTLRANNALLGKARTFDSGTLTVAEDLANVAPGAAVPWEQAALTALQASISGSIDTNMADFMIDGRRVVEIPIAERMKLITTLESRLAAKSGSFGVPVRYSFRGAFQ